MDGFRGRDYYSRKEFNEACSFNYWYGAWMGVLGTVLVSASACAIYAWVKNII